MDKQQAIEIIRKVDTLYPNNNMSTEIAKIWTDILMRCNYERTMKQLNDYYAGAKFAPHISDIAAYEEINYAQLQYEEIQRDIEYNKQHRDPERSRQIKEKISSLIEALDND